MVIDVDKLREDIKNECYAAFFGGGFGAALIEAFDIERMSDEEVVDFARRNGINLAEYSVSYY